MSTRLNLFFVGLLIVSLVVPAMAGQTALGKVENSTNVNQEIKNYEIGINNVEKYIDNSKSSSTINVVNEAPVSDTVSVSMLGVGDVDTSRLIMKGEVIAFKVDPGKYKVTTGSPVVVYTIWNGNDVSLLQDSRSEMIYTKVYHRFDHQMVSPAWIFEGYTNKCDVPIENKTYLVVDNRDAENPFSDNTMANIRTIE